MSLEKKRLDGYEMLHSLEWPTLVKNMEVGINKFQV